MKILSALTSLGFMFVGSIQSVASSSDVPSDPFMDWTPPEVSAGLGLATTAKDDLQKAAPGSQAESDAKTRLAEGEEKISDAGAKYKDNFPAQKSVVGAFNRLGDYDKAKPFADHAVDLAVEKGKPKLVEQALILRGDVNFGLKNYDAALKDAEAALKIDPKNKAALSLKYQSAGRVTGGATDAPAAAGADGGSEAAGGARRGGTKAPQTASTTPAGPRRAAEVMTSTPQRRRAQALAREAESRMSIDPASARPLAEKAVLIDPSEPRAYHARAAARRATGDLAGALADLEKVLALDPSNAAAHGAKASVSVALGLSAEEVRREFLASGRAAEDFADYYRDQVNALTVKPDAGDSAAGGERAAPGGTWDAAGYWQARIRENAGALLLLGLGLAVSGAALLFLTRRRTDDGRRDG